MEYFNKPYNEQDNRYTSVKHEFDLYDILCCNILFAIKGTNQGG